MKATNRNKDFRPFEFAFNTALLIVLLTIIFSCGAKKTNKSISDTVTATSVAATQKTDSASETLTQTNFDISNDEIAVEAVDTSKPVEIVAPDGKVTKYRNARITHKKSIDKTKKGTVNKRSTTVQQTVNKSTKQNEHRQEKNIDRKQFDVIGMVLQYWWILAIVVLVIIIYKKFIKIYT